MSVAERLDKIANPPPHECKYVRFVARLREQHDDPEQVEQWVGLVEARRISGTDAAADLQAELGERISADSVQKHTGGRCGCTA